MLHLQKYNLIGFKDYWNLSNHLYQIGIVLKRVFQLQRFLEFLFFLLFSFLFSPLIKVCYYSQCEFVFPLLYQRLYFKFLQFHFNFYLLSFLLEKSNYFFPFSQAHKGLVPIHMKNSHLIQAKIMIFPHYFLQKRLSKIYCLQ